MKNKQYDNDRTSGMIRRIRTGLLTKRKKTLIKKRESKLCYNTKRISIEVILSNIYEIRETVIYKELSRRFTLQEINTIK